MEEVTLSVEDQLQAQGRTSNAQAQNPPGQKSDEVVVERTVADEESHHVHGIMLHGLLPGFKEVEKK